MTSTLEAFHGPNWEIIAWLSPSAMRSCRMFPARFSKGRAASMGLGFSTLSKIPRRFPPKYRPDAWHPREAHRLWSVARATGNGVLAAVRPPRLGLLSWLDVSRRH